MCLVNEYKKYVEKKENKNDLLNEIISYNYENYYEDMQELLNIKKSSKTTHNYDKALYTSGTSGTAKKYLWGPNTFFWIKNLETFNKNLSLKKTNKILYISNANFIISGGFEKNSLEEKYNNYRLDYLCKINFNNEKSISFVIDVIESLYLKNGQINIEGLPNTFLYLFSNNEFKNYLIENKYKVNIISSTCWNSFFSKKDLLKNNIHINDCMINWNTGCNFLTCIKGTKHFLPTFVATKRHYINLLNLYFKRPLILDDKFIFSSMKKCNCGNNFIDFNFLSHYGFNLPEIESKLNQIIEEISDNYSNLQFVKDGNNINVLYVNRNLSSIMEQDREKITLFLKENIEYNKINFMKNTFIETAIGKLQTTWNQNAKRKEYMKYNDFVLPERSVDVTDRGCFKIL